MELEHSLAALAPALAALGDAATADAPTLFGELIRQAEALLDCDAASVDLLEERDGALWLRRARISDSALARGARRRLVWPAAGPAARTIESRTATFWEDLQGLPDGAEPVEPWLRRIASRLHAPLVGPDGVLGLLTADWATPRRHAPGRLALAEALGHCGGAALANARRLAEARRNRRAAERVTARARTRIEALLEGLADPVIVVDPSGRIRHANGRARDAVGAIAELPPTIQELGERLGPRLGGSPREAGGGALESPSSLLEGVLRGEHGRGVLELRDPAGAERRLDLRATPVFDAGGALEAIVLVAREVTGRDDVIETRARLDGAIKTARLVAHELNNRLTSLTGLGGMLAESDDPPIANLAQRVVDTATEVGELVSRLQELKRFAETTSGVGSPMLDLDRATMPRQPG
ncbi:MAG TPA: PAS domain-containing protein [Chloroflexota bacterium]|jgi:PAS domain-containing protein